MIGKGARALGFALKAAFDINTRMSFPPFLYFAVGYLIAKADVQKAQPFARLQNTACKQSQF